MTDISEIEQKVQEVTAEAESEALDTVGSAHETAAAIIDNAQQEAERIMDAAYIRSLEDRIRDLETKGEAAVTPPVVVPVDMGDPDPPNDPEPISEPDPEPVTADVGPGETVDLPPTEEVVPEGGEHNESDIAPRNRNSHFWYKQR